MKQIIFKNVWLCDDDADDHYVFTEALNQVLPQALLSVFANGKELLAALKQHQPDILFLDINMPIINGLEALQIIRSQAAFNNLPVVMYSVSEQQSDIIAAQHNGAVLYVVKPQLYQDVVSQLKAIFELDWTNTSNITTLHFDGVHFTSLQK